MLCVKLNVVWRHIVNEEVQLCARLCLPPQSTIIFRACLSTKILELMYQPNKLLQLFDFFPSVTGCFRPQQGFKSKLNAVRMIFRILALSKLKHCDLISCQHWNVLLSWTKGIDHHHRPLTGKCPFQEIKISKEIKYWNEISQIPNHIIHW